MVSILPCQGRDPGSNPGRRIVFTFRCVAFNKNVRCIRITIACASTADDILSDAQCTKRLKEYSTKANSYNVLLKQELEEKRDEFLAMFKD